MMREAVRCSLPPSPPERQPESMTAATTVTVTTSHARLPDFISLA
jgi:multidrug resistance efflux pump